MKAIPGALLILVCSIGFSQDLSPQAEISVITFGPGQEQLYTAFGHSAIRVSDPVLGIDDAYNYGVFDFDQPNFYLNFARGYLNYRLGVSDYKRFEYPYIYFNRYVHEQKLNLNQKQKQRLYDFLQWNAKPENQYYRYDYFYDNCATKIPGIMLEVFGDTVKFDGSYITTDYTIRELTDLYLEHQPWGDLAIDICLGLPMDKKATPYEYMFLPDYVESGFGHATITQNGIDEPLVRETVHVYESEPEEYPRNIFTPLLVFSAFFVVVAVISFLDIRKRKPSNLLDAILFSIIGLLGLLLLLLWVATDHKAAAKNLNILWALPTHLVVVFALYRNRLWVERYFLTVAFLAVGLLAAWPMFPQKLHYALIPLVMSIAVRAYTQFRLRKYQRLSAGPSKVDRPVGSGS